MNKNKGIISIGLIIAIVLGIVIVGGGAYYLEKSGSKQAINNPEILPIVENQNLPVVDNSQQVNVANTTHSSSITVLSPNGGEVYKDTDKIAIKWKSTGKDRIAIYLRFSSGEWCSVADLSSSNTNYTFTPYGHDCGPGRGVISGIQKYKITLIAYKNGGMAPEPGTAFAGDYNDGNDTGFSIDSSDNYFTINSKAKTISTILPQYIGTHSDCGEQSKCWPPVIATFSESYSCNIGVAPNTEGNYVTAQRVINGRTYCINSLSSGYAGGRGYTYAYTTSNGNGTKIATFGLTYQSCGVWQGDGTSKYSDCQIEQSTFKANLDNIIDSLM